MAYESFFAACCASCSRICRLQLYVKKDDRVSKDESGEAWIGGLD